MAWTAPVTDRTLTDINLRTAKAFFNVADFSRINGNNAYLKAQVDSLLGVNVPQTVLGNPTTASLGNSGIINNLVNNLNYITRYAGFPDGTLTHDLFCQYLAGNTTLAPNYQTVNLWESTQLAAYNLLAGMAAYRVRCGVATTGQPRFWQARFRG